MDRMKRMSIIWGIIVVMIIGCLTFIGFTYNHKLKDYKKFEDKLVKASEQYVEMDFLYPDGDDKLKVKMDDLVKKELLKETKVNGNSCKGYVIVWKNGLVYKFDPYIDCGTYKTEGYHG